MNGGQAVPQGLKPGISERSDVGPKGPTPGALSKTGYTSFRAKRGISLTY